MTDNNPELDPVDTPDGNVPLSLAEYREIIEEIEAQPRSWRRDADKEMDYAEGNQLDTELIRAMKAQGIPTTMENLIGAALEGIRGYEVATRTDWRVTPNGQQGGQDVADAINFRLNEAERQSHADDACSAAFYPQIAVGIGWVEVARNPDPFDYAYQCQAVHRNEIHWDWTSTRDDLSDARWLRRQRWLHPSRLARVFPEQKELIRRYGRAGINWWAEYDETGYGGGSTGLNRAWNIAREWTRMEDRWFNPVSKEVCVSELWYRRWSDVVVLKSPDGRVVEYDANNPAHVFALANGRVQHMRAAVPRVRRSYWLGPHCLFDGPTIYNHRHFPYVPFWGFREDGTGVPFGYVRGLIDQQDTLNNGNARLRWGMSSYRTERTKGAVAMADDVFRRTVARPDADIVLDAQHMAQPGAKFEVKRDFQANAQQLEQLQNARNSIERINPAASGAFSGRRGTATSGIQEQTQVEQANQSLSHMTGNFKRARTQVGELLMSMIVQDMGKEPVTVVIEGDAVTADRTVTINQPEIDPVTGLEYLSNDLQRTVLKVGLEDVPSTNTYRGQQLNAMSEAIKSLPAQYQAAAMPFLASLMDVPFKRDLVEALRAASAQESPEQIEQRIKQAVQDALKQAGNELKARELDIKERLSEAQIKELMAKAVQTGVQAAFSAMQGGAQVAMSPQIAPIADAIMQGAGYQRPNPMGADPNFPTPQGVPVAANAQPDIAQVHTNTSPEFPPVPQQPDTGMQGIETAHTSDNIEAMPAT